MNADDDKKLREEVTCDRDCARLAFALGRRAGLTEAAGICELQGKEPPYAETSWERGYAASARQCAADIEKAIQQ